MLWNDRFSALFDRCVAKHRAEDFDFNRDYSAEDLELLESIGYKPREFFDFVEDLVDEGEPSRGTALLVAAVRRDYFSTIQKGQQGSRLITRDDLPGFGEEFDGLAYLPRVLVKARGKLRGELDPDVMYCCGGDRNFLTKNGNIHPADFLRHVWAAGDDDQKVADWIKGHG